MIGYTEVDWIESHLDDPHIVLVDTRPAIDYASGHIPGAINVQPDELLGQAPSLLRYHKIVIYAEDSDTAMIQASVLNVVLMQKLFVLHGGYTEWVNQGKEVESTPAA